MKTNSAKILEDHVAESNELYPQGIKWYGDWVNRDFYIPRGYMLPVQVELEDGTLELWPTSSPHHWGPVKRWRRVNLTQGTLRRLRKAAKITAEAEMDA